jgi:acetyl esterase/lipase
MELDRRTLMLGSLAAGVAAQTPVPAEPDTTVALWPGEAPGAPAVLPVEEVRERSADPAYNDRILLHPARPRMAVFRPARPNGAQVLIMPGGGYNWVVIDKEGFEMARWLSARGVTAHVLFYRLPQEGWAAGPDTPLADAQRAMRLIRARALGEKICAIGFSAGGHVCADLVARFDTAIYAPLDAADRLTARPDAAAPIYPVVAMHGPFAHAASRANLIGTNASAALEAAHAPDRHITAAAPPCFLLHAEDDTTVPVQNTLMLRDALKAHGVATETHLFADGGHGFGLRLARGHAVEHWPELYFAWGRRQGLWP